MDNREWNKTTYINSNKIIAAADIGMDSISRSKALLVDLIPDYFISRKLIKGKVLKEAVDIVKKPSP